MEYSKLIRTDKEIDNVMTAIEMVDRRLNHTQQSVEMLFTDRRDYSDLEDRIKTLHILIFRINERIDKLERMIKEDK